MDSEAQDAVNAGQRIFTCSEVISKSEIVTVTEFVSDCASNDNPSDDVSSYCEIKRSVILSGEEYSSLDRAFEIHDGKYPKEHLDENVIPTMSSEVNPFGSSTDSHVSGSKTESVAHLPPTDQKAAPGILMHMAEETGCNKDCASLPPPSTDNTSFQASPTNPSVNFLSMNVPSTEVIHKGSLVITNDKNEDNNDNNFGTSLSQNDPQVTKNLDELPCEEQDQNIADDITVDHNDKGINLENDRGKVTGNSPVPSKNEESACSFPNDGAKIYNCITVSNDSLESKIVVHPDINQGEKCDSEIDKPIEVWESNKNENPHFRNCNVENDCGSKQSELQNSNKINDVMPEDGTVNALVAKDCGDCNISNENMHSFAAISDSNKLTTVVSKASCKGPLNYRDSSDSSSESELTSSSDDESVTEITDLDGNIRKHNRRPEPVCHGEILLTDLPPIEDLNISVPEEECIKIGEISSIVGELAVIQALPNTPALNIDSVLFLDHGKTTLGKIFDVLGPVKEPFYTVRFNSEHHARERGVTVGVDVFCAPRTIHTAYVFLGEMMKMKGSDASWEHNNEPPLLCLDYSDDEQERLARRAAVYQRYGDDRDGGPPRKKRGMRNRMGNSNQSNGENQRGSFADSARPDTSPVRGYFSQSLPHATSYPPLLPPRPVYPSVAQRVPGGYTGQYNSPHLMLGGPPPNFRPPMRTGYSNPLFESTLRNFAPSASPGLPPNLTPQMSSPPPYFIRPFHMLPSVPLVPLPPLPPYLSSPHVRPLLCPPRFRPPMDDKRGPGNF